MTEKIFLEAENISSGREKILSETETIFSMTEKISSDGQTSASTIKSMVFVVEATVSGAKRFFSKAKSILCSSGASFAVARKTEPAAETAASRYRQVTD